METMLIPRKMLIWYSRFVFDDKIKAKLENDQQVCPVQKCCKIFYLKRFLN